MKKRFSSTSKITGRKPAYALRKVPAKLICFLLILGVCLFYSPEGNAQILKNIGKKIEQQAERRAERKIDRTIDKGFDKVEEGVDKSVRESTSKKEPKEKPAAKKSEVPSAATTERVNFLTDDEPYNLKEAETVKMKDGLVMVSANCDDYIWFKPGATMTFQTTMGKGKNQEVAESKMLVKEVKKESGKRVSIVQVSGSGIEMDIRYLCAGNNLYVDMGAAMREAMLKAGQTDPQSQAIADDLEMGFGDGFMDIPKNMYPGQKLDDVNFTMKTGASGVNMTITSVLSDRKVGKKEKITTPAGTFECMPVSGVRKTSMKVMGMNQNMGKPTTETTWYSPGIGIVKMVSYDAKGGVETTQILTEFKR